MIGIELWTILYNPFHLKQSLPCFFLSTPTPLSTYFHPYPPLSLFFLAYKIQLV